MKKNFTAGIRSLSYAAFLALASMSLAQGGQAPVPPMPAPPPPMPAPGVVPPPPPFVPQGQQWGVDPTPARGDPTKPVSRGYIIPTAEPIPGGARINVEIYHKEKATPITLWLQVALNDGKGEVKLLPIKLLSDKVNDNADSYYSHRSFDVTYDEMNQALKAMAPGAKNAELGPGSPVFVYAQFEKVKAGDWVHQWGGMARGGAVFLPGKASASSRAASAGVKVARPTELDLAYNIDQTLANQFNDPSSNKGLKVGGQIRSRVEAEGKFQIPLDKMQSVRDELFKLANNPSEAAKLMGDGWTFKLEDRYLLLDHDLVRKSVPAFAHMTDAEIDANRKKLGDDASKYLKRDSRGFPIPDAMDDVYLDNATRDAAKHDMAFRYRWTEGNKTGSWNFKPGTGWISDEGVVYRNEFAVDTMDNDPAALARFADSDHPLNFFKSIRQTVPGAKPSDFLSNSVRIVDNRYKFKMQHTSGLIVELSLDDMRFNDMRDPNGKTMRSLQMEMDVDHLATQSTNVINPTRGQLEHLDPKQVKPWLEKLDESAFLEGRPVLHEIEDVQPGSVIRKARAAEFDLATKAIEGLRTHLVGTEWLPGAQKYALAAHALGLTKGKTPASLDRMFAVAIKHQGPTGKVGCQADLMKLLVAHD